MMTFFRVIQVLKDEMNSKNETLIVKFFYQSSNVISKFSGLFVGMLKQNLFDQFISAKRISFMENGRVECDIQY